MLFLIVYIDYIYKFKSDHKLIFIGLLDLFLTIINLVILVKLEGVSPFIADPPWWNSTTDADTHTIIYKGDTMFNLIVLVA